MALIKFALNAGLRLGMVRGLSGMFPLYIVNEYPRSGGNWVCHMLSHALKVPFVADGEPPVLRPSVLHGHYLRGWGMRNVVVVWRDGRDVMVSYYHLCCFVDEFGLGRMIRKELPFRDYENIRENLPAFIKYTFEGCRHPPFSWAAFVRQWYGRSGVTYVRYEDILRNTSSELQRIVLKLTGSPLHEPTAERIAEVCSFKGFSGRSPSQEDKKSFFRKAAPGDWRNYFTDETRAVFQKFAGKELSLLGYTDE